MILLWTHSHSVILSLSESRECMKVTIACLPPQPLSASGEICGNSWEVWKWGKALRVDDSFTVSGQVNNNLSTWLLSFFRPLL